MPRLVAVEPAAASLAGCFWPVLAEASARTEASQPVTGRTTDQQSDVAGLEGEGVRAGGSDQAGQRGYRVRRGDVVVGAVDVEERAGDRLELAGPVSEQDLPGMQCVVSAQPADHLHECSARERHVIMGPVGERPDGLGGAAIVQPVPEGDVPGEVAERAQHLEGTQHGRWRHVAGVVEDVLGVQPALLGDAGERAHLGPVGWHAERD